MVLIERYALSPMKELWQESQKFSRWLTVEIAYLRALEEEGAIPGGTAAKVEKNAAIDLERIQEIERTVDHDVVAFIKAVSQTLGEEERFFHKGLTSSDIVDTALSLVMKEAACLIQEELKRLAEVLLNTAKVHKNTIIVGRTHGVHAEPTSFGLKMLGFYSETLRNRRRLSASIEEISVGKLSGAVGNYSSVHPDTESRALSFLGLKPCAVSTQVIPRDIHAEFVNTLALIGNEIERLATEIRLLQRTEVLEVEEPFKQGQRGSSAMPHKKNPVHSERLSGLARLLRSYTVAAGENTVLWHERDISHSSAERVIIPDATQLLFFMLREIVEIVSHLFVNEERMRENLSFSYGLVFSHQVMIKLIEKGLSRERAYEIVQRESLESWKSKEPFIERIKRAPEITSIMDTLEIEKLFDPSFYLRNVDEVFRRFENGSDSYEEDCDNRDTMG
ncbi:MAG: Adenylosuccinate lyase [Thermotogales bacterium 46_20]|nr:MAG: Adenylosuccinate lyase [Thermotogales bacterium 46_20]